MPAYATYKICRRAGQDALEAFYSTGHYRVLRNQGANPPTLTLTDEDLVKWSNAACDWSDYDQDAVIQRALDGEWLSLYRLQIEHDELKADETRAERQWQEHLDAGGDPW